MEMADFNFLETQKKCPRSLLRGKCRLGFYCNLRIRDWEQKCVWLFYHFNFERNYDVLK